MSELILYLGLPAVLFAGLLAYSFWSTPKCMLCGAKVKWSRDKQCEACAFKQKERQRETRRQLTETLLAEANIVTASSRSRCPKCGSTNVTLAVTTGEQLSTSAALVFWPYRCGACEHLWVVRKKRALIVGIIVVGAIALIIEVAVVGAISVLVVKEIAVADPRKASEKTATVVGGIAIGLTVIGFTAAILWWCLRALRLPRTDALRFAQEPAARYIERTPELK